MQENKDLKNQKVKFKASCTKERDEWVEVIQNAINAKPHISYNLEFNTK